MCRFYHDAVGSPLLSESVRTNSDYAWFATQFVLSVPSRDLLRQTRLWWSKHSETCFFLSNCQSLFTFPRGFGSFRQ